MKKFKLIVAWCIAAPVLVGMICGGIFSAVTIIINYPTEILVITSTLVVMWAAWYLLQYYDNKL